MSVRCACMTAVLILCGFCASAAHADEVSTLKIALDAWKKDAAAVPAGCEAPSAEFPRLLAWELGNVSKAAIGDKDCVICIVTCRFGKEDADETVEYRGTFLITPRRLADSGFSLKATWRGPLGAEVPIDESETGPALSKLWPGAVEYVDDERTNVHVAVFEREFHEAPAKPKDEFEQQEIDRALEAIRKTVSGKRYAVEFRHASERSMEMEKIYAKLGKQPMHAKPLFYDLGEYDFERKVLPLLLLDQALFRRDRGKYRYASRYVGFVEVLLPVSEDDAKAIKRDEHKLSVFVLFGVTPAANARRIEQPEPFRRPTLLPGHLKGAIPIVPEGLVVYDKDTNRELLRWTPPARDPPVEKQAAPGNK